jgi:ATP phosphoribosyltransferase
MTMGTSTNGRLAVGPSGFAASATASSGSQARGAAAAPLVIAVPSKGRLQENAAAFFQRAGLPMVQPGGARDYRARLGGMDNVEVLFLSASDIVTHLASGAAHLGVTGEDLVREQIPQADEAMELMTPLGFGHANVVVAVPQAWIDVRSMGDLEDVAAELRMRHGRRLRIATKYVNLTRGWFARYGVSDYRIVESLGATEGAPASGTAEAIVDITTTGATLVANNLKVLEDGVILRSEAHLVASMRADWSPAARAAARIVLSRIAAEEEARMSREVRARTPVLDAGALSEIERRFHARAPLGQPHAGQAVSFVCPRGQVYPLVAHLEALGASEVLVSGLDAVFRSSNPLVERLSARIGAL